MKIGTDIVNIERIKKLYKNSGEKFLNRILSENELLIAEEYFDNPDRLYTYIAKRFAGKEAISKAFGTGIGDAGSFNEISIENDENGAPIVILSGKALEFLEKTYPNSKIEISLSDDHPFAIAFVTIERLQEEREGNKQEEQGQSL